MMIEQPLAFAEGTWSCAWCAAPIANSKIQHRDSCRWIEDLIEKGIELAERGRTRL